MRARQAGYGQPRGVSGADEVPAASRQPDIGLAAAACLLRASSARGWTITTSDLEARFAGQWSIKHEPILNVWSAERISPDGRHRRFLAEHSAQALASLLAAAELAKP